MEGRSRKSMAPDNEAWPPWLVIAVGGCLVVAVIVLLLQRRKDASEASHQVVTTNLSAALSAHRSTAADAGGRPGRPGFAGPGPRESAEEIVARKASQFARSRREVLYGMARKYKMSVPREIEEFFEAAEAGDWEKLQAAFRTLTAERRTQPHPPELDQLWGPILATFNSLEEAHLWPAQEFLNYGNAVLDSLRPGMVYVGGTDPGRGIPELLNETSDGEHHVVITQNGLADGTYLDYLRFIYGDRLAVPSPDQISSAFSDYVADYQQRLAHDQQFPNEPKQVLPGENVNGGPGGGWSVTVGQGDQQVQVSGQVSAMAINERILQTILQQNPDATFGLEESFPLKSTYGDAAPLGPIMELRAQDTQNTLNADTAGQSVEYWQETAQQLLSDPAASSSPDWLKAYSKMVDAQANLFAAHSLNEQAEDAFRVSLQIWPGSPEAVYGYVGLLTGENRTQDALGVAQSAAQTFPNNTDLQNLVTQLQGMQSTPAAGAK